MVEATTVGILVAAAFVPPLIYMIVIRNVERHWREPWRRVLTVFFYGALVSVLFAVLLELLYDTNFHRVYQIQDASLATLILVVVAAPVIEEFTKGLGVRVGRPDIDEPEDGIVYGAAAGLGFSATENLFYELAAEMEQGLGAALGLAVVRSLSSSFLHATATGVLGYGMARRYLSGGALIEVVPYYAIAVLIHAGFNLLASLELAAGAGFLVFVSVISIAWTVKRIRLLDKQSRPAYLR